MEKAPTLKKLVNDIAKAVSKCNGHAIDKDWGSCIATAHEEEQYNLIAWQLKKMDKTLYSGVTVDTKRGATKYKPEEYKLEKHNLPKEWKKIDMIMQFSDYIYLIQFKILRPMGGKANLIGQKFIVPLLTYFREKKPLTVSISSMPHDIIKLNELPKYKSKPVKKFIAAIYYPSDNLKVGSKDELIRKLNEEEPNQLAIISALQDPKNKIDNKLKSCSGAQDFKAYKNIFHQLLCSTELKSKMSLKEPGEFITEESRYLKLKRQGPEQSIFVAHDKFNFSYLFHKKVKVIGWEVK